MSELRSRYPGSKVELNGEIRWAVAAPEFEVASMSILSDSGRGEVRVVARGANAEERAEGAANFVVWQPARVATRRVMPGERLRADAFAFQNVNVTTGMAREYRGVILGTNVDVASLESRQTILEGQPLLSSAVQRVPDIRRGEPVRILIRSGELELTTQGSAEEPAYLNDTVRVMTGKTKRQLVGRLQAGGVVEVNL